MHAGLGERSTVEASWRRRAALSLGVSGGGHLDLRGGRHYLNTVGVILMVAGALGLVLSLLFWSSFSPYRRSRTVAGPDTVVEERRIERDLP
jgi:hypothetical protein